MEVFPTLVSIPTDCLHNDTHVPATVHKLKIIADVWPEMPSGCNLPHILTGGVWTHLMLNSTQC